MLKHTQIQRLMFLFAVAGLFAVTADFACLDDVCADLHTGAFQTMDQLNGTRIQTLGEALGRFGTTLTPGQRDLLARDGQLLGVAKLDGPIKHPNGTIEMPKGWLPAIPEGHPWGKKLTPEEDAYYSFVEERIFKAKLFDPSNPEHKLAAETYLKKRNSSAPEFVGWSYASRTECAKRMLDAKGTMMPDRFDAELFM